MTNDSYTEGIVCSWCGTYFEKEHGYPVLCSYCFRRVEQRALKSLNIKKSIHNEQRMGDSITYKNKLRKPKNKNILMRFLTYKII